MVYRSIQLKIEVEYKELGILVERDAHRIQPQLQFQIHVHELKEILHNTSRRNPIHVQIDAR